MEHQYSLQAYKKANRFSCPECNEHHQFTFYVDCLGEQLHESVGRCNRSDSCGYHYTPKQYFLDNPGIDKPEFSNISKQPEPIRPGSFISHDIFEKSGSEFQDVTKNNFILWLLSLFDLETVNNTIEKYRIGTSTTFQGGTIFWQIDNSENIRTGKIMNYDPSTGKRVKKPFNQINWVHTVEKLNEFNLQQCLYGSHLLAIDINKTVAIVESEKTCILASMMLPQYIWISRGGKNGAKWYLNDVHKCLIGRKVILFPDLADPSRKDKAPFDIWTAEAEILKASGIYITVSRFLEDRATDSERIAGCDIADFLIKDYTRPKAKPQPVPVKPSNLESDRVKRTENDLEEFFKYGPLPMEMKIESAYTITDVSVFVKSHLEYIRDNRDVKAYKPYIERLELLRRVLNGSP